MNVRKEGKKENNTKEVHGRGFKVMNFISFILI
jgi:hypothetical protein